MLDPGFPAGRTTGTADFEYHDGPRPLVLTAERQVKRLASMDFPVPVEALERMRIPKSFNPRSPAVAARSGLRAADQGRAHRARAAPQGSGPRPPTTARSPGCAPSCARIPATAATSARTTRAGRSATTGCSATPSSWSGGSRAVRTPSPVPSTGSCALLTELDYLRGDEVTEHGKRLARLYGELDLLASECLRDGVWEGLSPAELAACVSALVYEARQADDAVAPKVPGGQGEGRARRDGPHLGPARRPGGRVQDQPGGGRRQREPDLGFAWAAYQWASDRSLDEVLREAEMPAGDFVRWSKQVIDVLGQIAAAAPREGSTVAKNARKAVDALLRGVVAYSSVG